MNNRLILIAILGLLMLAGVWYSIQNKDTAQVEMSPPSGEIPVPPTAQSTGHDTILQGKVIEVDTSAAALDGPVKITLEGFGGNRSFVTVPSMGFNFCAAKDNIIDVWNVAEGTQLEVKGTLSFDGMVTPCESTEHYVRIVQ